MNGYIAFYSGRRIEIYAETLFQAKEKAIKEFKPKKSQRHMVSVLLAERETGACSQEVIHSTCEV